MRDELRQLLVSLESELRALDRWETAPPPPDALASTRPFAFDTLSFDQWLQWILLPRLTDMLRRQLPLPAESAIRAMAEVAYAGDGGRTNRLIVIIDRLDALLNQGSGRLN